VQTGPRFYQISTRASCEKSDVISCLLISYKLIKSSATFTVLGYRQIIHKIWNSHTEDWIRASCMPDIDTAWRLYRVKCNLRDLTHASLKSIFHRLCPFCVVLLCVEAVDTSISLPRESDTYHVTWQLRHKDQCTESCELEELNPQTCLLSGLGNTNCWEMGWFLTNVEATCWRQRLQHRAVHSLYVINYYIFIQWHIYGWIGWAAPSLLVKYSHIFFSYNIGSFKTTLCGCHQICFLR